MRKEKKPEARPNLRLPDDIHVPASLRRRTPQTAESWRKEDDAYRAYVAIAERRLMKKRDG